MFAFESLVSVFKALLSQAERDWVEWKRHSRAKTAKSPAFIRRYSAHVIRELQVVK